jgi:hypothetical protein
LAASLLAGMHVVSAFSYGAKRDVNPFQNRISARATRVHDEARLGTEGGASVRARPVLVRNQPGPFAAMPSLLAVTGTIRVPVLPGSIRTFLLCL